MIYLSTSTFARDNGINRDDLFLDLCNSGLIIRDNDVWCLTQLGEDNGGIYKYNDKGERWIVWPEDFDITPYVRTNINNRQIITSNEPIKILCLANSFKEGGRCLAGIQVDDSDRIITRNKKIIWFRPVCNTNHEEVPNHLAQNIQYFDILKFRHTPGWRREDYQSENLRIKNNQIEITGHGNYSTNFLSRLCENNTYSNIFGNNGNAVTPQEIESINYSLMMLKVSSFELVPNNKQFRLRFQFKNNNYDLPITDPKFLHACRHDQGVLDNINTICIVLSLGVPFDNGHNIKYYKLVTTIFY